MVGQAQQIRKKDSACRLRWKWVACPAVLLVIAGALAGPPPSRAESLASRNKEGNKHYAEGKFKDAEKAYLDAQVKNPGRPEVLYNLGNSLVKQKKYGQGFQALRQAIDKGDREIKQKSWYNIGDGLFLMGDYEASADAFIQSLKLNPGDRDAKHNLEMALMKLKQQEQQKQEKKPAVDSRQSAVNPRDENRTRQERQQQRREGALTREQAIQLLDAIQNQEREEQRKTMERRALQRSNERDW